MMNTKRHLLTFLALFSFVNFVEAELMLRPPGLEDGDQYRLMFTTSRLTDAVSGDPQFYDDFVQSVADDAPIVGSWNVEWQAFMAVGSVEISERVGIGETDESVPVYRVDGELFVDGYQAFYEPHFHTFSLEDNGTRNRANIPCVDRLTHRWKARCCSNGRSISINYCW